jgi:hypothetical protein
MSVIVELSGSDAIKPGPFVTVVVPSTNPVAMVVEPSMQVTAVPV